MKKERLLKSLQIIIYVSLPMLLLFKVYNLIFYVPFVVCAGYIAFENYKSRKTAAKNSNTIEH